MVQDGMLGEKIVMPAYTGITPEQYHFIGWTTQTVSETTQQPTVYTAGSSYSLTVALQTLYAFLSHGDLSGAPVDYLTDIDSIAADDSVVITMNIDSVIYAMINNKGVNAASQAVAITVQNQTITSFVDSTLRWNIKAAPAH